MASVKSSDSSSNTARRCCLKIEEYQAMMNHRNCMEHCWLARVQQEPHKLCGSMKARQQCPGPWAGKDTVCISYNEMLSINLGAFLIYTSCSWGHLRYFCISIHSPSPRCSVHVSHHFSPVISHQHLQAIAKCSGHEHQMFTQQRPPSVGLSSLKQCLQVLHWLCSGTVCIHV